MSRAGTTQILTTALFTQSLFIAFFFSLSFIPLSLVVYITTNPLECEINLVGNDRTSRKPRIIPRQDPFPPDSRIHWVSKMRAFYSDSTDPTISKFLYQFPCSCGRLGKIDPARHHLSVCIDQMLGRADWGVAEIIIKHPQVLPQVEPNLGPLDLPEAAAASGSLSVGQLRVGPERTGLGLHTCPKPIGMIDRGVLSVRLRARFRRAQPPTHASGTGCLIIQSACT